MKASVIKQLIPTWLYQLRHKYKHRQFINQSNAAIFSEIYDNHLWGGNNEAFHSGIGTIDENAQLYLNKLSDFFKTNSIHSVVEIGCGDFRLMKSILDASPLHYTGIDVVPNLINHLNQNFANERISFMCADAVTDILPSADVCIIRQVLQHLSNDQILSILKKCDQYRFVIITEHLPIGSNIIPNKDKPSGPDVRMYFYSGVFVESPPFNQKAEIFIEYRADYNVFNKMQAAVHRTYLIKH